MARDAGHLGYQGDLGFWGTSTTGEQRGRDWWRQDMSDAGQALYSDPQTGLQTGLVPQELLTQYNAGKEEARKARGGFMSKLVGNLKEIGHDVDTVLSNNVVGWGITKQVGSALWYPVDKVASGAYWLYSNAVSQPLATAFLASAEAEQAATAKGDYWMGSGDFWSTITSGDTWSKNYEAAEHISPAQAFMNAENVATQQHGGTLLSPFFGVDKSDLSVADSQAVQRNANRFLYDTEYWRQKQGWSYTVGTGAMDFALSMGADPAYVAVKGVSSAVKASRGLKLTEGGEKLGYTGFTPNALADAAGKAIGNKLAKTPEEASRGKKLNDFFDWAEGKSPAEIAQHPIWGKGRRRNVEADRLSALYAGTARDDMPLLFRFAGGDNNAAAQLAQASKDTLIQVGKVSENRVLVDSAHFDPDILQHFIDQESKGLGSPANIGAPGVLGTSQPYTKTGQIVEPPYPRPTTPGPAQQGWDKSYGHLADSSKIYRQASGDILKGLQGVRPMTGAAAASSADVLRAQKWREDQLALIDKQLEALQSKQGYYGDVLGRLGDDVEDFSPGKSRLFGTMTDLYRQGPLAIRSSEKAAEKGIARMTGANVAKQGKGAGKFGSRYIRNGFYTPMVKVVQSFGDRVPETLIDHTKDDAFGRVSDMLRGVKGLDPNVKLGMINSYANAGDKVARGAELDKIHAAVIEHMASQYNLNPKAANEIAKLVQTGQISTMSKLTSQVPNAQMFGAGTNPATGLRVDMVEDGNSMVISPLAKAQLSVSQPLLDVKEMDRYLKRNSGVINDLMQGGMDHMHAVKVTVDALSTMWKAATLLRPGYVLRSMSEEQAASAVKFGVLSSISDLAEGGWNLARNRATQVKAHVGKGSYVATSGKGANSMFSKVRITDPDAVAAAEVHGLPTSRINVGRSWPVIDGTIEKKSQEIAEFEKAMAKEAKKANPNQQMIAGLQSRIDDNQIVIDEFTAYAHAVLAEATTATGRRLGEKGFEYRGQKVPEAFSKEWAHPIPRDQITSAHAMESLFARAEAIEMNRLIKTGSWTTIAKDQEGHMDAWLRGLNSQYRLDPLFQKVAEDPTLAKAKAWLKTPDGKSHMHDLGIKGRDPETHLSNVKYVLDSYLPSRPLQEKLAKGDEILEADLRGAIREEDFPPVHGEEFTSLTAHGRAIDSGAAHIDRLIEHGFNRLGTIPNDIMARQPIYLRAQEAHMRKMIDQELSFRRAAGKDDSIDMDTLNQMLHKSDKAARKTISTVVYDPTRTTATEALRFFSPFMAAHMDGLERWAGLVAEKPEFVTRAAKIYNAPVAAQLVTDQYGRPVDQNGMVSIEGPDGKIHKEFVPIDGRTVTLRVPGQTEHIKGIGDVRTGGIPIRMSALNTILPGDPWFNPGAGPYMQIGMSEIAKKSPEMGDFFQWSKMMPYGPSKGRFDPLMPKYLKDAWNYYTTGETGSEQYGKAYLEEWQRQSAVAANGGPAVNLKEVERNAKHFMFLDALASWAMPAQNAATPLTGSPYQFFLDQYKAMQQIDPENARANFHAKFGDSYFPFTADLSKSIGIQASLSAENVSNEFGDLIAMDPSLSALFVGDVYNKGPFSTSVYRKQFDEYVGGVAKREKITPEEAIKENQIQLGWLQYNKYSQMIDAEMIRSGFHSYNQKGAEALTRMKQVAVEIVADGNDDWFNDFGTVNTSKLPLRIKAMQVMVQNKKIMSDPFRNDAKGIAAYLQQRELLQAELRARGAQKLSFGIGENANTGMPDPTGENADIGMKLRTLQLYLVNNNLEFADVFHRYLEHDDLS